MIIEGVNLTRPSTSFLNVTIKLMENLIVINNNLSATNFIVFESYALKYVFQSKHNIIYNRVEILIIIFIW